MKFLMYSLNYEPELTGIGKYNGELAKELIDRDGDVIVVTAPPYYPEWEIHKNFNNTWSTEKSEKLEVHRTPLYVPKKLSTLKRIIHLSSFALTSGAKLLMLLKRKPDFLFLVQPTLFCAPMALIYCKLTGAKSIMHIQDFEVDAMFGLGMGKSGRLKSIVQSIESWFLKRFDVVSSISFSMLNNAKSKGVSEDKLLFFPNWSDTSFVTPDVSGEQLKADWGYNQDDKIVLYSGNIGQKQGLDIILDAAELYKEHEKVKFLIIGNGAYREVLEENVAQRDLKNIAFKPLQAWEDVPKVLAMADIHLVVQKKGAADAVLPSKLTNILSCGGHTLVTAEEHTELGVIANKHPGIYELVEPEDLNAFVAGLNRLLDSDTQSINKIARQYAVDNLTTQTVIDRFVADLNRIKD